MEKYLVIARARALDLGSSQKPFTPIGRIGPCFEDQAVVQAYPIVRWDSTPNVGEYWLVRDEDPQTWASRIVLHTGAEPICDACFEKNEKTLEPCTRYRNQPSRLERCSLCGVATTEAWFIRLPPTGPLSHRG